MPEKEFFERLRTQYGKQLPFVAWRKPEEKKIQAFLQENDQLFTSQQFSEAGFIFAPFDERKEAILVPEAASEKIFFEASSVSETESGAPKKMSDAAQTSERKAEHVTLVQKALQKLKSGKLQKVVLSRKEQVDLGDKDAVYLFQELLKFYPTAFVYIFYHPRVGLWLGATPETLLKVEGNRFKTMALAGTQTYSGTTEVEWGSKEKQEQQLVTDEIVSGLRPQVQDLSVGRVHTVRAGGLLHLRTDIEGRLISPLDSDKGSDASGSLKKIIGALHPTPAVCGLPGEEAKDFILLEENYDREFYTGFLGEINLQKNVQRSRTRRNVENLAYRSIRKETDLYVNLRCMKIEDGKAILYIGGGITADSVPEDEWQETVNKAGTMKKVLLK